MERAVQHYVSSEVLSAVVCAPRRWTSNESSSRCPRNGGTHARCVRCTNIRHAREEPGLYADAIGVGNRRVQPWAIPPLKLATSAMSAQLPACPSFVEYGTGGDSQSDSSWSEWPTQAQQRATERESTRMREALLPLCTPPKRCPFDGFRRAIRACPPPHCAHQSKNRSTPIGPLAASFVAARECSSLLSRYPVVAATLQPRVGKG